MKALSKKQTQKIIDGLSDAQLAELYRPGGLVVVEMPKPKKKAKTRRG